MKLFQLICLVCLFCVVRGETTVDTLVDTWLSHARKMMSTTQNQEASVPGITFQTKCGAMGVWSACNVTADFGYISDMSSLYRFSSVVVNDNNNSSATISVNLGYRELAVHYPNLLISGNGIKIEYEDIKVSPNSSLPFTVDMVLDYSRGVDNCTNAFKVTSPTQLPKFIGTIGKPPGALPEDPLNGIVGFFLKQVSDHVKALITYESLCERLVKLI